MGNLPRPLIGAVNIFLVKPFLIKSKATCNMPSCAMQPLNRRWIPNILILGCLTLLVSSLFAQNSRAQSIDVGDSEINPTIRLYFVNEDNTFRTAEDQVESTGVIVTPTVAWTADRRLLSLSAGYQGNYGSYDESILDFYDHALSFAVDANPRTRHRLSGSVAYVKSHETLGTGQAQFLTDADDQIESTLITLRTNYTFGATGAQGNLGGGLVFTRETFDNLAFLTDGDDNSIVRPYALFSYRVSPDTRLVAETRYSVVDFDDDRSDRDEVSFLVGLDMNATARTGGNVRLGVTKSDYDTAGVPDRNVFVADVNVTFRPRTYSSLNLSFNRGLRTVDNDVAGLQESIVDALGLRWSHQWGSRFSTTASYAKQRYERNCPQLSTDTDTVGLELGVNIRRWISVGIAGSTEQRRIGDCNGVLASTAADYDVSVIGVFLNATL